MGRFAGSLRVRLIALVLLSTIPAFGLIAYTADQQREDAATAARTEALLTAERVAAQQEGAIEGARQLLVGLSKLPPITDASPTTCPPTLASLLQLYPAYTAFWVTDIDGALLCSSSEVSDPINQSESSWFKQAMMTGRFTVGEYQIGRITGRPVVALALPIMNDDGQITRLISASLDLAWLNTALAATSTTDDMTMLVLDRGGTVLATHPDAEHLLGAEVAESEIGSFALQTRGGTTQARGLNGETYLFGVAPFASESGATVSVGVPVESAFATADALRTRTMALLGLVTLLALIVAGYGGEVMILRRVQVLAGVAQRLRAGDLTARTNSAHDGELGALSRTFDEMAAALHERDQALREREAWFRLLLNSGRDALYVYPIEENDEAGRFVEVNDEACARLGYTREEFLQLSGKDISDLSLLGNVKQFLADLRMVRHVLFEGVHIAKDGRRIPVEVSLNLFEVGGRELVLGVARDVTERRRAAEALEGTERRQRALLQHGNDLILVIRPDGIISDISPSVERLFGFAPEAIIDTPILNWVEHDDYATIARAIRTGEGQTGHTRMEVRVRTASGETRYIDVLASNLTAEPSVSGIVVTGRDVTERRRDQEDLARQAKALQALSVTDELTGLHNRRGFMMIAEQQLKLAQRNGTDVLLLFADMDGLKSINDTHGHQAGSEAIAAVAHLLRETFRDSDVIARMGGDEFVVTANYATPADVQAMSERLQRALDTHNATHARPYTVALSMGSAVWSAQEPTSLDELLAWADTAMYEDKSRRRMQRAA